MQQHQTRISPLYADDFYAWTQHQAKLLRAVKGSASELPSGIDLDHLAEEIEDLGKAELHAVTGLIRQIMVHLIKGASNPKARAFAHWRTEATTFNLDLPDRYAHSMRQLIDMQDLWRRSLKAAEAGLREHESELASNIAKDCPYSLDELLSEAFDFDEAVKKATTNKA